MQEFTIALGESIRIGKDVRVKALKNSRWLGVNFGIQAPQDVEILREEARNRKPREKKKAPTITVRKRRTVVRNPA
ncbi:MAG: hypothetical protein GY731_08415 [Gammaproteobacteria bacterium]|nr:hypothetical protein [Gammaproteobacteria bacterium]